MCEGAKAVRQHNKVLLMLNNCYRFIIVLTIMDRYGKYENRSKEFITYFCHMTFYANSSSTSSDVEHVCFTLSVVFRYSK